MHFAAPGLLGTAFSAFFAVEAVISTAVSISVARSY
jgi:hypothetical protein